MLQFMWARQHNSVSVCLQLTKTDWWIIFFPLCPKILIRIGLVKSASKCQPSILCPLLPFCLSFPIPPLIIVSIQNTSLHPFMSPFLCLFLHFSPSIQPTSSAMHAKLYPLMLSFFTTLHLLHYQSIPAFFLCVFITKPLLSPHILHLTSYLVFILSSLLSFKTVFHPVCDLFHLRGSLEGNVLPGFCQNFALNPDLLPGVSDIYLC